ncbi:uncharacterized protein LOC122638783 [Telopea speciosissima]|uniref:uncharacterized protein LOC122638783 n=1 Tax=Telopea speciosissima TaxID=54955 RepID=UPI001CC449B6|nr:uncharacterized protein LOC122638783 [Telopea speciosissima]
MVNTRNRNRSPPWDDAGDVSEEDSPVPPPVNTNTDVAALLGTFCEICNGNIKNATWIRDLEMIFEVLPCNDIEKIRCATFQLRGDVDAWWRSSKEHFWAKYPNATWAQFTEAFLENYFSRNFREKKEIEFMSLIQGSKSVLEYQQAFEEYFYFAPTHLKVEEVKARRFERGLRANLSTYVVLHKYPTYAEVVQVAKLIEDQQREDYRAIQAGKRPMSSHDFRGPNKFQKRGAYTTVTPIQSRRPDVAQAPKATSDPYYETQTFVCYNCKESSHMVKNCPHPRQAGSGPTVTSKAPQAKAETRPFLPPPASKTQGRVYSITHEEAQSDPSVITGIISVCSLPAYVLFDSGVSHSFISPSFAEKLPIRPARMEQKLIVYTSTGSKVELDQAFNSCPVRVSDHGLEASLVILDMKDFDIILGMDWLSTHGASLICAERKILFKSEEGKEFVFKGNKSKKPRKTII